MKDQFERIKIEIDIARYNTRFYVLAQVGALTIIFTSVSPFIPANNIPAALILTLVMVGDHWHSAKRGHRLFMTTVILLLASWIHVNMAAQWFSFPVTEPIFEYKALYSRDLGAIGSFLVILSALLSFKELRNIKNLES